MFSFPNKIQDVVSYELISSDNFNGFQYSFPQSNVADGMDVMG